jgi:hypothetical protein
MAKHAAVLLSSFPYEIDLPIVEDTDGVVSPPTVGVAFQCLTNSVSPPCAP